MGGSVAQGFPNQVASGPFYGVLNQPNLGKATVGRRGIPRGPTPSSAAKSTWRRLASAVGGQCRPHQNQIRPTVAIAAVCYF